MTKRALLAGSCLVGAIAAISLAPSLGHAETAAAADGAVTEVVVTAQKREERLRDVPVPVTVVSAAALTETGETRFRDFYSRVPGLNVQPNFYAQQSIAIRGITSGSSHPTVGVIVDDVPFGGSTIQTSGYWIPDLDPGDLARVEVLRGPQGTLYGANSMGGLIKYVTVEPSTAQRNGEISAGASAVAHGGDVGYTVRGAGNMPLSDSLAIRGSLYYRREPGYIDNPVFHIKDANTSDNGGGYASLLWRPSDVFSLRLNGMFQATASQAPNEVDITPTLGKYQQNYLPSVHGADNRSQVISARMEGKVGDVRLTSVTAYNVNDTEGSIDWTYSFGPSVMKTFGVGGAPFYNHTIVKHFTQEFRAGSSWGDKLDWIGGVFYSHEIVNGKISMPATDLTTGKIVGDYRYGDYSSNGFTVDSVAGFADVTYHFTSQFDVQVGGRYTHDRLARPLTYTYGQYVVDFLHAKAPFVTLGAEETDNAFTYLVTPRYKLNSNVMIYARFASGYRPGAPNGLVPTGIPQKVDPDYTATYEGGVKGVFLDGALSVDGSIYYIDWKDIQLNFFNTSIGIGYSSNGGRAKSQGVELDLVFKPWKGATLETNGSYMDAVLTQTLPATSTVQAKAGDRLPNSSRFSGSVSFNQDFPLFADYTAFVGGNLNYVGDRVTILTTPSQVREKYPAYSQLDLRLGVRNRDWSFNLYANNAADQIGVLSGGSALLIPPYAYVYTTPRTVGFNVTRHF